MAVKEKKKEKPISVDDEFIKDFVLAGGRVETDTGSIVDADNVDALLEEVGKKQTTSKQEQLHERATELEVADTRREDALAAKKEDERIEKMRQKELAKRQSKALNTATKVAKTAQDTIADPVLDRAGTVIDKVSRLRTVGGIGLLLAVLVFLLFVVVRVNAQGDTRIKQLWYMLNGRANLIGRVDVAKQATDDARIAAKEQREKDQAAINDAVLRGLVGGAGPVGAGVITWMDNINSFRTGGG